MAPLCQELVQSAYISVANGLVQYVCWLQPVKANKGSDMTLEPDLVEIWYEIKTPQ